MYYSPVLVQHVHQGNKAVGCLPVVGREHWHSAERQGMLGVGKGNVVGCVGEGEGRAAGAVA